MPSFSMNSFLYFFVAAHFRVKPAILTVDLFELNLALFGQLQM